MASVGHSYTRCPTLGPTYQRLLSTTCTGDTASYGCTRNQPSQTKPFVSELHPVLSRVFNQRLIITPLCLIALL